MTFRTVLVGLIVSGCGGDASTPMPDAPSTVDGGIATPDAASGSAAACGNGVVEGDELCDGSGAVSCTSLAAVWGSGDAHCRSDCAGYDTSGCTLSTQTSESVFPVRRDARWSSALCNDGTPFNFDVHMAPVKTDKWIIYVEGGGSCDPTYTGCGGRGASLISSSPANPDRGTGRTINIDQTFMSRDPSVNPDFYDANIAFGRYCSSDGWSGTNTTPQTVKVKNGTAQFVFAGRNNARAYVATLCRAFGVNDDTSEVLLIGNSAGGYGAGVNIDLLASRMPRAVADGRLALVVSAAWESGLWNDPSYTEFSSGKTDGAVGIEILASYQSDANPRCLAMAAATGVGAAACAAGPLVYASAALPPPSGWGVRTFVAKNRLDQGPMSDHGIPTADATRQADLDARATWLADMTESMAGVAWLYAPADPDGSATDSNLHGIATDPLVWPYEPPGHPGQSLREMIGRFWAARAPGAAGERLLFDGDVPHTDKAND